jgi:dUTP pyrophosphatase
VSKESVDVLVTGAVPLYAHPGDAGADLVAQSSHVLAPGERVLVDTGVSLALPDGYVAYVMPRSGLALKHGIALVNSPGVIDAGYRGEIKIIVINHDPQEKFRISKGDRIAQLVIHQVSHAIFHPVGSLPGSDRSTGGFGSTGVQKE